MNENLNEDLLLSQLLEKKTGGFSLQEMFLSSLVFPVSGLSEDLLHDSEAHEAGCIVGINMSEPNVRPQQGQSRTVLCEGDDTHTHTLCHVIVLNHCFIHALAVFNLLNI